MNTIVNLTYLECDVQDHMEAQLTYHLENDTKKNLKREIEILVILDVNKVVFQ